MKKFIYFLYIIVLLCSSHYALGQIKRECVFTPDTIMAYMRHESEHFNFPFNETGIFLIKFRVDSIGHMSALHFSNSMLPKLKQYFLSVFKKWNVYEKIESFPQYFQKDIDYICPIFINSSQGWQRDTSEASRYPDSSIYEINKAGLGKDRKIDSLVKRDFSRSLARRNVMEYLRLRSEKTMMGLFEFDDGIPFENKKYIILPMTYFVVVY